MFPIDALVALIKKIFPNENCTSENVADYAQRLALKNVSHSDAYFASVEPQPEPQPEHADSLYAPQRITPDIACNAKKGEPYATLKRMRQIVGPQRAYWIDYTEDAEVFCMQAAFMKDFTDDYDQTLPLDTYRTTYGKMHDAQLRTYFTWRTKVRQGVVEETSLSYVFCYIFELLNGIGVADPADAMEKLLALWVAYRPYATKLDHPLCSWLRDYYVVHRAALTTAFSAYSCRFPVPYYGEQARQVAKVMANGWANLRVIEAASSFQMTSGQFYKGANQPMMEACACFVVQALARHLQGAGVDLQNLFFEKRHEAYYTFFKGAVHPVVSMQPAVIQLDEFERMKWDRNGWNREYICTTQYRPVVGYILKCIEVKMRQHFGYKRSLQLPSISVVENSLLNSEAEDMNRGRRGTWNQLKAWKGKAYTVLGDAAFLEVIAKAISDYCIQEHIVVQADGIKVVQPVEIDLSKLKDIERDHIETAKKLITEESRLPLDEAPIPKPAVATTKLEATGMAGLVASLSDEGRAFLRTRCADGELPPNGELLIEEINEKALEVIGDQLIAYADGVPDVYDDYIDELKSSLGGQ